MVSSYAFEITVTFCILLNTALLCLDYNNSPANYNKVLYLLNIVFAIIFALEATAKLIGLGPRYYFSQGSNVFDFVIVVSSLITMDDSLTKDLKINLTALRIFRVARLLRMIKASKTIQNLLKTLYLAINNIVNVAAIYALILFTFTVAGMDLFGDIIYGEAGYINKNANFNSFYIGMIVLLRVSTGESWPGLMYDTDE